MARIVVFILHRKSRIRQEVSMFKSSIEGMVNIRRQCCY